MRGLARLLRRNPTEAERALWDALTKDRRFAGRGFKRQTPIGRHWNGGDAFRTAWFNALSMSFPVGEQFFIDAVREGVKRLAPEAHQPSQGRPKARFAVASMPRPSSWPAAMRGR